MSIEKCMAFCTRHERACDANLRMLDGQQRGGDTEQRTHQRAKGKQTDHLWLLAQGGKCRADLAVKRCPPPNKNDRGQHTDGVRLERRKVAEHSLLREHKSNSLSQPCQDSEDHAAPGMPARGIGRFLMGHDHPANPCQGNDNASDLQCGEHSPKNTQARMEPKIGARLHNSVPRRGPRAMNDWNRKASPRDRPMMPERRSQIQRADSAENGSGSRKRMALRMIR